jgi:5-methylcytosine-specific restriction endonuclease McrA
MGRLKLKYEVGSYINGVLYLGDAGITGNKRTGYFKCCDCGNIREVAICRIKSGVSKVCRKCANKRMRGIRKYNNENYSAYSFFNAYKRSAKKRGYSFSIDKESFLLVSQQNCHYCGRKPSMKSKYSRKFPSGEIYNYPAYTHNGIDRVNNNLGYSIDNIVPCCTICNRAKNSMTYIEYTEYLNELSVYRTEKIKSIQNESQ